MANVYATKTGNWSDTTVWNTGSLPTAADDVYANNFTVTVDVNTTVISIRNTSASGINAGGLFQITSGGITIICTTIVVGTSMCINVTTASPGIVSISGSGTGGTGPDANVVRLSGSGTVNLTGNYTHGTGAAAHGVMHNSSSGIINITGNCSGSTLSNIAAGAYNNNSGILNITGSCIGGSNTNTNAVYNFLAGTINITGNCTGGSGTSANGVFNASTGTVNITGTCTGGTSSTAYGAINNSTGTINHIGTAQASATTAAIGNGSSVGQVTILTGPLLSTDVSYTGAASSGVNPCIALRWFPANTALSTFEYRMRGQTLSGSPSIRPARQMYLPDAYDATYPSAANVRTGTSYGVSNIYTGTCAVPGASSVLSGVPVDNTTGTVTITASTIRAAVGLAAANLDTQLSATAPATVATAVRTNLTPELTRLAVAATTPEVADIVTAVV
jgi:hypothetical protein